MLMRKINYFVLEFTQQFKINGKYDKSLRHCWYFLIVFIILNIHIVLTYVYSILEQNSFFYYILIYVVLIIIFIYQSLILPKCPTNYFKTAQF